MPGHDEDCCGDVEALEQQRTRATHSALVPDKRSEAER